MAPSGARPADRVPTVRAPAALLMIAVRGYRLLVSPLLAPRCRHLPTCSEYALEALGAHGAARGAWLTLRRLARCHPWGTSGYDPVPEVRDAERQQR